MSIKPYSKNLCIKSTPSTFMRHPSPPNKKGWRFLTRRSTLLIPRFGKWGLSNGTKWHFPPWHVHRFCIFQAHREFFAFLGRMVLIGSLAAGTHLDAWRKGAVSCQIVLAFWSFCRKTKRQITTNCRMTWWCQT